MTGEQKRFGALRRNRISFEKVPSARAVGVQGISDLRIERTFPGLGTGVIDLSVLGDRPSLARSLAVGAQQIADASGSPLTMRTYHYSLRTFGQVLVDREAKGGAPIKRLADLTASVLSELFDAIYATGRRSCGYARLNHVKRVLREVENVNPGTFSEEVLQHLSFVVLGYKGKTERKRPYTDREAHLIEEACREDIRLTLTRLRGRVGELRRVGKDPREAGWADFANALWYYENVLGGGHVPHVDGMKFFHTSGTKVTDLYRAVYPSVVDFVPFFLMFCLKTGLNPWSALSLKRNCLEERPNSPRESLLHYVKLRSEGAMTMVVRNEGTFSPGGLIRAYLKLTEKCASTTKTDDLWLCVKFRKSGNGRLFSVPTTSLLSIALREFVLRHNLKNDSGESLELRADRLRTTRKTLDYRRANGDIGVPGHDHRNDDTTVGYINNRVTEEVHNQAVMAGQRQFHEYFSGVVVPDGTTVEDAAKLIGADAPTAEAILNGQQEMLIANCKNMFDAPGGSPGQLCGKVWSCFGCPNAVWTSRILPNVLWYMDFLLEQRRVIPESEWEKKFGYPYALITNHVLPAFPSDVVAQAKTAAEKLRMYVPPEMRTT